MTPAEEPQPTPLTRLLAERIAATGPITLADYMAECLMHPQHGYYSTRDPFGVVGDFITAPEISQMFGELLGLFLAQTWLDQGRPAPFTLAELGPGRGTLMADILRATRAVPGFRDAARVYLLETSPTLRARQKATLDGFEVTWINSTQDLPDAPLFLVANEFFDALPIRQFTRTQDGWSEHLVSITNGKLTLGLGVPARLALLAHRLADTKIGDIVETCAPAQTIVSDISRRIAQHGGGALIIDYGSWRGTGDTFQALRNHTPQDPFATPGEADLTAHVDFEPLARKAAGAGARPSKLETQGVFLEQLGITTRAQTLARNLTGPALEAHISAHRRLTHPEEMGTLFKVLGVTPSGASMPPGLGQG